MGSGYVSASDTYYGYGIGFNIIYNKYNATKRLKTGSGSSYSYEDEDGGEDHEANINAINDLISEEFKSYIEKIEMSEGRKKALSHPSICVFYDEYLSEYEPAPTRTVCLWGYKLSKDELNDLTPSVTDEDCEEGTLSFKFPKDSRNLILDFLAVFHCKYYLEKNPDKMTKKELAGVRSKLDEMLTFGASASVHGA